MLSRGLAGARSTVCLQCRLRLARAARLAYAPIPRTAVSRSNIARRYFSEHAAPRELQHRDEELDSETSPDPDDDQPPDIYYPSDDQAHWRYPRSMRRSYISRGHVLTPEERGLGVDMLGKPGSAIVLREKFTIKKREPQLPLDQPINQDVDLSSLLDGASQPVPSEVVKHIQELKPEESVLPSEIFNELIDKLVKGFTRAQLKQYMVHHDEVRQSIQQQQQQEEEEQWPSSNPPWVVWKKRWTPAVEAPLRELGAHLQGYITRDMAPKTRLAVRLVRECWGVENEAVVNNIGSLTMKLRDVEFELLTLGNKRWFEGTHKHILEKVKEVRLVRENQTVSVLAPMVPAEKIVQRIHEVVSLCRTEEVPVDLISSAPLHPNVLQELGQVTNTVLRLQPSGKTLTVSWIHQPRRNEDYETACDTVIRLLRNAFDSNPRVTTALAVLPGGLEGSCRWVPLSNRGSEKWPWHERLQHWERWTLPIKPGFGDPAARRSHIPDDFLPFDLGSALLPEPMPPAIPPPSWSSEPKTETLALFGQIAFSRSKSQSMSSLLTPASVPKLEAGRPRTFFPSMPPLPNLWRLKHNLHESGLWHTSIVLRFVPSHGSAPHLRNTAPDLELRIEADHKEIKEISSLRAIQSTFIGDVLFPSAAVDTRLVQHRFYHLPGTGVDHHVPAIAEFLKKSDLRPWDGKLTTPRSMPGVRLPRHFLYNADAPNTAITPSTTANTEPSSSDSSESSNLSDPNNFVEVDYDFASIEIRRAVASEYQGLKMRYTSIQAGLRGGERAELSVEAARVNWHGWKMIAKEFGLIKEEEEEDGNSLFEQQSDDPFANNDADAVPASGEGEGEGKEEEGSISSFFGAQEENPRSSGEEGEISISKEEEQKNLSEEVAPASEQQQPQQQEQLPVPTAEPPKVPISPDSISPFPLPKDVKREEDLSASWQIEDDTTAAWDIAEEPATEEKEGEHDGMMAKELQDLYEATRREAPVRRIPVPMLPVEPKWFLSVVRNIVNEMGPLKWHSQGRRR